MFFLNTKLSKNKNLMYAIKPVYSYGFYRWKFLTKLFWYQAKGNLELVYTDYDLKLLKFYLTLVLINVELDSTVKLINIQLKKSLQTYQGLRLSLDLPVRGQRTRTNASTQRMLARNPRKRHFVQKWNWRKFAPKEQKKYNKEKINEDKK